VAGILYGLGRLARREGGVNGDFFGAAIVLTETAVLAACL
jgi:cobalamin synthase